MSGAPSTLGDAETVKVLREIKTVETEWDAKLRGAREEAELAVRRAREEAAATLKAVLAEMAGERAHRLEAARAACEVEVEAIRREGADAAEMIRSSKEQLPTDRTEAILAVVLGPFAGD